MAPIMAEADNGRRQVFAKMFKDGNGLNCFANYAGIFICKVEEKYF